MNNSERATIVWVVSLLGWIVLYLSWPLLQVAWPLPPDKTWLDVASLAWAALSAAATLAAVGVALWFGLADARRRHAEALAKARLAAAKADVVITAAIHRFGDLAATMDFRDILHPGPEATMKKTMGTFIAPIVPVDMETLVFLVPLPRHCAVRTARAFGLLTHVQTYAQQLSERWTLDQVPASEQEHHLRRWGSALDEAIRLLSVAQEVCQRAALEGAPYPTGEELWGD